MKARPVAVVVAAFVAAAVPVTGAAAAAPSIPTTLVCDNGQTYEATFVKFNNGWMPDHLDGGGQFVPTFFGASTATVVGGGNTFVFFNGTLDPKGASAAVPNQSTCTWSVTGQIVAAAGNSAGLPPGTYTRTITGTVTGFFTPMS